MDESDERRILTGALTDVGFEGAQLGTAMLALLGGPDVEPSKEAVRAGVGFTAKRLRLNIGTKEAAGPYPLHVVRDAAVGAVRSTGQVLREEQAAVVAIVRRGFLNMNPAVVTIRFPATGSGHGLAIRAVALEGLIKQRAGEKAAHLLYQRITGSLASSST